MIIRKGPAFITTMAWVGVGLSALSAVIAGASAYAQADNNKHAAEYNSDIETKKAKDAANIGANEAADIRARTRKLIASQVESGAMSGVDVNYGSTLGLLVDTAGIGEKEALTVMNNAQRQAWGHTAQSQLDQFEAKQAGRARTLNTFGSAISGASSVYSTGAKSGLWK